MYLQYYHIITFQIYDTIIFGYEELLFVCVGVIYDLKLKRFGLNRKFIFLILSEYSQV